MFESLCFLIFFTANPILNFTPDHIETSTSQGKTVTEIITLKNTGFADLEDVSLSIVNQDGSKAPDWVYISSTRNPDILEAESNLAVNVMFAPHDTTPQGDYAFYLRIKSSNYDTTDIGLYASVVQQGFGDVMFKISDIYTGTLDNNHNLIQGVSNAKILLQNESVSTQEYTINTDDSGEALLQNIPAGRYKLRVRAANHQEQISRIWIKPGVAAIKDIFLEYNLVTVEWEVTEITIEDEYEIVLTTTYETDVPAPVMILEPAYVTLPDMQTGDVLRGEFTLTNYGLIRADNLEINFPGSDSNFKYEVLTGLPTSLGAKERIIIPYKITCLEPLQNSGNGTGDDDCGSYRKCMTVTWDWNCVNGESSSGTRQVCGNKYWGCCTCSSAGSVGNCTGSMIISGGYSGGWGSGPGPSPTTFKEAPCIPENPYKSSFCDECNKKETNQDIEQKVNSSVNTVTRGYIKKDTDLTVKIPGATLEYARVFMGDVYKKLKTFFKHIIASGTCHVQKLLWASLQPRAYKLSFSAAGITLVGILSDDLSF